MCLYKNALIKRNESIQLSEKSHSKMIYSIYDLIYDLLLKSDWSAEKKKKKKYKMRKRQWYKNEM